MKRAKLIIMFIFTVFASFAFGQDSAAVVNGTVNLQGATDNTVGGILDLLTGFGITVLTPFKGVILLAAGLIIRAIEKRRLKKGVSDKLRDIAINPEIKTEREYNNSLFDLARKLFKRKE